MPAYQQVRLYSDKELENNKYLAMIKHLAITYYNYTSALLIHQFLLKTKNYILE